MALRGASILVLLAAPFSMGGWVRVASPHVEVFTDAGERTGRAALARFEEIRRVFQVSGAEGRGPVRVFEFSSESEFHSYYPAVAGFHQSGPERDYIALPTGADSGRVAFHEYVHEVLSLAPAPLPRWFEEGTADFYSTLARRGDRWRVGEPIDSHVAVLGRERWLSAAQLEHPEREYRDVFYAESWALVHMLNLSAAWRNRMPQFALLLSEGQAANQAFQSAFGKTLDQAVSALPDYVRSIRGATVGEATPKSADPVRVEIVPPLQAALALADLALHVDRLEQARRLIERLPQDSLEVIAEAGALARAEGNNGEARRLLTRAIELGSRDAATYFEYAMVEQDAGATTSRVEELLGKAIKLNPEFADAQFLLGVRQTDDGRLDQAIEHLKIATRARPRRSDYWHALGYAQSKAGRTADALLSARRAAATASNTGEEGMAQGLVEGLAALAQEHPPTPPPKRNEVITPASWAARVGDARVEGVLVRFDCENGAAKMLVRSPSGDISLNVLHPGGIEMVNAPSKDYQFQCGAQEIPLIVEYLSDGREVTRIEFRP